MTASAAAWRVGFATTLLGIGLGRFAYAPLVPGMVAAGWMSPAEAAVAAAANFVGYLIGAVGALLCPLAAARRLVMPMAWATAISLLACSWFGHMLWFSGWRLVAGVGGAWLMIVAVSTCLTRVAPTLRPRLSGRIFSGIGVGIIASAGIGWLAAALGVAGAWLCMGLAGVLAAAVAQQAWAKLQPDAAEEEASPPRLTRWVPALVVAAYALDAVGFIPHSAYWVDYLVREVGYSEPAGAMQWWLFGVGSTLGPLLAGRMAAAFGAARSTACAYAAMAGAIALPLLGSSLGLISASSLLVGGLVPITVALTSATLALLVAPAVHARWWAIATLGFSIGQAGSSSAMAAAYAQLGSYVPLLQVSVAALLLAFGLLTGAVWLARR
ncbi:YbfB/YjiJ family MFS transporter [bacterium]|nr:YbfB/YjiJ family MFS transporter [bacterium]